MYPRFDNHPLQTLQTNHIWLDVGRMVFAAVVIAAILLVVYKIAMHMTGQHTQGSALEIAKQRLAKGEINAEDYAKLKKELEA